METIITTFVVFGITAKTIVTDIKYSGKVMATAANSLEDNSD